MDQTQLIDWHFLIRNLEAIQRFFSIVSRYIYSPISFDFLIFFFKDDDDINTEKKVLDFYGVVEYDEKGGELGGGYP
jgi:hypothetical protein